MRSHYLHGRTLNLFIVYMPDRFNVRDLAEIGELVMRKASDIQVHVVSQLSTASNVKPSAWELPSVTVSLAGSEGVFLPARGPILKNKALSKFEQFRRMKAAGLPMPRTGLFRFGDRYDESEWSEFVVLKPADLRQTSHGKGVRLMRTCRLDEISRKGAAAPDGLKNLIVQTFIDSGPLPTVWRPMTMFGRTLYCMKSWSPMPRPELTASNDEIEAAIIEPKQPEMVSAHRVEEMRALAHDKDVVDLARRVHDTVPTYPLLGCDIMRDAKTGKVHLIEMNAGGNVWHFSSKRAALGLSVITREQRIRQYGAWDIAADALIQKTRTLAA